ncbi:hypothetical protein BY458DRAFT_486529 [Sporodiniella umbellata]|nr:hypothetical protein BY458DRAFT_486529 [Sporodiniella umbellata]
MNNTRKRTCLKPSQIAVLEETFMSNALPEYHTRCSLAKELDITERTIQIWFQNRRTQFRKNKTMKPIVRRGWVKISNAPHLTYPKQSPYHQKVFLPATGLSIGKWSRFANRVHPLDLVCFGDRHQFYWQVKEGTTQFRIQIQYQQIQRIVLTKHQLIIEFLGTPWFSMKPEGDNSIWMACADFTENCQATHHKTHCLEGNQTALKLVINHLVPLLTHRPTFPFNYIS